MNIQAVASAVLVGLGATLLMDLWALLLRRAFNVTSLNFCLVGRWLGHMPGRFRHANIGKSAKKPAECLIGWSAHYLIGVAFALALALATGGDWLEQPSLSPALTFGIGTVLIPLFIMQPCLGLGVAAAKTPNPAQARIKSLITHTVFGLGLYLSAMPVSYLMYS